MEGTRGRGDKQAALFPLSPLPLFPLSTFCGAQARRAVSLPQGGILGGVGQVVSVLFEELVQEGDAPAAAGAGAAALGELAGHLRLLDPQVLEQLPLSHAEAKADVVIEFHRRLRTTLIIAARIPWIVPFCSAAWAASVGASSTTSAPPAPPSPSSICM